MSTCDDQGEGVSGLLFPHYNVIIRMIEQRMVDEIMIYVSLVATIHPADVADQCSVVGAFRRSQVLYAVEFWFSPWDMEEIGAMFTSYRQENVRLDAL